MSFMTLLAGNLLSVLLTRPIANHRYQKLSQEQTNWTKPILVLYMAVFAFFFSLYVCLAVPLTLYNPALFGPYNTRGGADLSQSFFLFSWTPGWSDLLKIGLRIKFLQKSSIWDPLLVSQSLSSRDIAVFKKKKTYILALRGNFGLS